MLDNKPAMYWNKEALAKRPTGPIEYGDAIYETLKYYGMDQTWRVPSDPYEGQEYHNRSVLELSQIGARHGELSRVFE